MREDKRRAILSVMGLSLICELGYRWLNTIEAMRSMLRADPGGVDSALR